MARAAARSGTITANGLLGRPLTARSRASTGGTAASPTSWYPPIPFTATSPPAAMTSTAAPRAAAPTVSGWSDPYQINRGPHSGQATGSAWKRRSPGSWYSAAQRAHSGKPRMAVRCRS